MAALVVLRSSSQVAPGVATLAASSLTTTEPGPTAGTTLAPGSPASVLLARQPNLLSKRPRAWVGSMATREKEAQRLGRVDRDEGKAFAVGLRQPRILVTEGLDRFAQWAGQCDLLAAVVEAAGELTGDGDERAVAGLERRDVGDDDGARAGVERDVAEGEGDAVGECEILQVQLPGGDVLHLEVLEVAGGIG